MGNLSSPMANRLTRLTEEVEAKKKEKWASEIREEERKHLKELSLKELEGYLGTASKALQEIRDMRSQVCIQFHLLGPRLVVCKGVF